MIRISEVKGYKSVKRNDKINSIVLVLTEKVNVAMIDGGGMFEIDVEEALNRPGVVLVDVRSEGEYDEATIPGAVNIPFLDNVQRSLVGTAYRWEGPDAARRLGLKLFAPQLENFYNSFKELVSKEKGREVIVFCWRGGERSRFVAGLLNAMGIKASRIKGGYKAYRRFINQYLDREFLPHRAIVVYGLTGVGKTDVLKGLAQEGVPVLDLEGLAAHRGSVFGKIGMPPSPSQKMFESLIVRTLIQAERYGVIVVECESRRLGRLLVPKSVINTMKAGYKVLLYAPLEVRVERIKRLYASENQENIRALQESVTALTRYLGKAKVGELNQKLAQKKFDEVFSYLLSRYYDPLYGYPDRPDPAYDLSVNAVNLREAVEIIRDYITELPEYKQEVFK